MNQEQRIEQLEKMVNNLQGHFITHTHNMVGTQPISYKNLINKPFFTVPVYLPGTSPATSGNYGIFFTFPSGGIITGISEVHGTAGTDSGSVVLGIEKLTGTQASGAGIDLLATDFNLKATHNTVQTGTLIMTLATNSMQNVNFNTGDRLGLVLTGTPTSIADLVVVVTLIYN